MKLSDFNYPQPQSVKGQVIVGKTYSLSEQADVLKILTELHNLWGIILQGSTVTLKCLHFYFLWVWYFPFKIIIFHILDEIRLMHQISRPWIGEAFDIWPYNTAYIWLPEVDVQSETQLLHWDPMFVFWRAVAHP